MYMDFIETGRFRHRGALILCIIPVLKVEVLASPQTSMHIPHYAVTHPRPVFLNLRGTAAW